MHGEHSVVVVKAALTLLCPIQVVQVHGLHAYAACFHVLHLQLDGWTLPVTKGRMRGTAAKLPILCSLKEREKQQTKSS